MKKATMIAATVLALVLPSFAQTSSSLSSPTLQTGSLQPTKSEAQRLQEALKEKQRANAIQQATIKNMQGEVFIINGQRVRIKKD